jgi:hypothetical protein
MEKRKQKKRTEVAVQKSGKRSSFKSLGKSSKWLVVTALIVLVLSLLVYQYGSSSFISTSSGSSILHKSFDTNNKRDENPRKESDMKPKEKPKEKTKDEKDEKKVTYDAYVDLAVAKQWSPIDPLEKLMSIAITYNQMFDLHKAPKESERLLQMVEKEFKFVLNVLLHSTDSNTRLKAPTYPPPYAGDPSERYIDLTPVLFEAIDGVHRGIVRAGKQTLQNTSAARAASSSSAQGGGVVTRQQAEGASMKYQYGLVFALLRLVNQVTTPSRLATATTSTTAVAAFPHLFIDMHRSLGRYHLNALGSAVSLGLYRLYEPLVMLGADCSEALLAAVRNGDDLSLSMLLHLAHTQPRGGVKPLTSSDLTRALAVATALQFPHLKQRLEAALDPTMEVTLPPNVPFYNEFFSVQSPASPSSGLEKDCSSAPEDISGGFLRSRLEPAASTVAVDIPDDSLPQTSRQCVIDVLHASTLNVTAVSDRYLRLGRPMVIRGLLEEAIAGGGWNLQAFKKLDRSIKVTPNLIPYGDQLTSADGQEDGSADQSPKKKSKAKVKARVNAVSLAKYTDVMREYSLKVHAWVDTDSSLGEQGPDACFHLSEFGGLKNTSQFLEESDLPYYVFDNKVCCHLHASLSDMLSLSICCITSSVCCICLFCNCKDDLSHCFVHYLLFFTDFTFLSSPRRSSCFPFSIPGQNCVGGRGAGASWEGRRGRGGCRLCHAERVDHCCLRGYICVQICEQRAAGRYAAGRSERA